ncbi:hypothetical protein GCM10022254_32660 [Actinomadura meridiana]|uniref:ATPase AAA-type core domain-containing protein n=1 Tax=Actinomadura meridiana TaxID=559626 RepID=A0ABP8C2J7_9ACTN
MAKLRSVWIEDFRAYREALIPLESSGLILVAGPNNAGKSALLSALDVVGVGATPPNLPHGLKGSPKVRARFELSQKERLGLLGLPFVRDLSSPHTQRLLTGVVRWIEWEYSYVDGVMVETTLRVAWPIEEEDESVVVAAVQPEGKHLVTVVAANEKLHKWSATDGYAELAKLPIGSSGNSLLEALKNSRGGLATAAQVLFDFRAAYFHFTPLRQSPYRIGQTTGIAPNLANDGTNLQAVLLHMSTNWPEKWRELNRLLESIVPGIGQLMTPINGNNFEVLSKFEYRRGDPDRLVQDFYLNLKDLGTGVEQLLMTLVVGLTQDARVVLIEEPETGLHPAAQRALLAQLRQWSRNRLFVASTHSPAMLDWSGSGARVFSVSRSGYRSTISEVTTERVSLLKDLGVRLSDVLSADRILIVEGPSEQAVLDIWFPDVVRSPRVALISGEGGDNARHTGMLQSWLNLADQLEQRKLLYVRDRDELPKRLLEKLEEATSVCVLPVRELENLLLNFDAIAIVMNSRRGKNEPRLNAESLAQDSREVANGLKQAIILKRTIWDLEPLRYVDNRLKAKLAKENADSGTLISFVLDRLPSEPQLRQRILESWKRNSDDLEANWERDWLNLVPGADLLEKLWVKHLGCKYNKQIDCESIARVMKPPQVLVETLKNFMAD